MNKIYMASALAVLVAGGGIAFYMFSPTDTSVPSTVGSDATVVLAQSNAKAITIYRDPSCGCCDTYAEYLEANGYQVTRVDDRNFDQRSIEVGVPEQGLGCHLAEIGGYYVSGLVPTEIIERLVAERPDIAGITLPGMPPNAPGMAREKTGSLKTFSFGEGGVAVYSDE